MSKLTIKEVEHIAFLARLALTDDEKWLFQNQLSAILEYVEILQQLDTNDIPPTTSALPLGNVMRPDTIIEPLTIMDALANAPDSAEDSFRVKPVFD
ncbi:MAG: aspartyl/glutamyl-tRNA(Asn/Gln) amidotransferase subunit C [Anaerolineaceae bacterium 4572_78]|nr:MAG: aspartyl/glutamyl-tRNA(Asn/Gln) amidotransferase subunit C [Anaerolineaceae bacterium 4572_78]